MTKKEFERLARLLRIDILEMVHIAGSGHIGGSFSIIDILLYIYFIDSNIKESIKKYNNEFSEKEFKKLKDLRKNIDKVVISKAHASPALYSILMNLGAIDKNDIYSFRRIDGKLEGHISKKASNFIDYSGGSLGQGLSFAVGIAKYFKSQNISRKVYAILGDGELDEGQNYEAMFLAKKLELDNLCVIIDKNKFQLDGSTEEILDIDPLEDKFKSFGFNTISISGHDFDDIKKGFKKYSENKGSKKPFVIIANTIKGKGVSFMENTHMWHGKAPNKEEYKKALIELGGIDESN